jgi:hypothetical protein
MVNVMKVMRHLSPTSSRLRAAIVSAGFFLSSAALFAGNWYGGCQNNTLTGMYAVYEQPEGACGSGYVCGAAQCTDGEWGYLCMLQEQFDDPTVASIYLCGQFLPL